MYELPEEVERRLTEYQHGYADACTVLRQTVLQALPDAPALQAFVSMITTAMLKEIDSAQKMWEGNDEDGD